MLSCVLSYTKQGTSLIRVLLALLSITLRLCWCSFITGLTQLPLSNWEMAVGYDAINDTILLLGGVNNGRQLTTFKSDDTFRYFSSFFSIGQKTYGLSQQYTQIKNTLWMIDKDGDGLVQLFIDTYPYNAQSASIPPIPISVSSYGACLTSVNDYLIVIGGGGWGANDAMNAVQIYAIIDDEWLNAPSLDTPRTSLSCVVVQDKVYAIGGFTGRYSENTIEILDVSDMNSISTETWNYMNGILSTTRDGTRSVVYGTDIYVVGGWDDAWVELSDVHIINTLTEECTVIDTLSYATSFAASIIVRNTLFVFGGCKSNGAGDCISDNRYQYYMLPTSNPTSYPTSTPTSDSTSTNSTKDVIPLSSAITSTITFTTDHGSKNTDITSSLTDATSSVTDTTSSPTDTTLSPTDTTTTAKNTYTTSSSNTNATGTTTAHTDVTAQDTTSHTDTTSTTNIDKTLNTDGNAVTTVSPNIDTSAAESTSSSHVFTSTVNIHTQAEDIDTTAYTDASAEETEYTKQSSNVIIVVSIVSGGVICCALFFVAMFYMKRGIQKAAEKQMDKEEENVAGKGEQDEDAPADRPIDNTLVIGEVNGVPVVQALPVNSASGGAALGSFLDASEIVDIIPGSIDMMPQSANASMNEAVENDFLGHLDSIPYGNKDDDILVAINRTADGERNDDDILNIINNMEAPEVKRNDGDILAFVNPFDGKEDDHDDDNDILEAVNRTTDGYVKSDNPFEVYYDDNDVLEAVNRTNEGYAQNDNPFDDLGNADDNIALPQATAGGGGATNRGKTGGETEEYEFKIEGVDFDYDEDGAKDVKEWLESIGYSQYGDLFVRNGFDSMELIKQINAIDDLNGIGISLRGHQLKIVNEIKKLKK